MAGKNYFDQFDKPGAVPLTQGDPRRAPELQRTQAEAARATAEAPYAGQTAAARAREAAAQATKAEIEARNAKEQWDTQHQPAGTSGIYGDDYLKTLHPSDQSMVKALKEGRLAFPQGAALRAPFWQEKLSQVAQYDPTFDATDYNARAKGRSNAIAGKLGVSNNNLNTAIGHAGKLYDQISGTASHNFTPLNAVENPFNRYILGDKGVTDFEQTAGLLADELEAAYRNGGGAEAGVVRQLRSFNTNASQDQKAGVIRNAIDLLSSKMQANLSQYNFGTGGKPAWDMLDPHTRDVLGAPQFSDIRDRYFAAPGAAPGAAAGASGGPGAGAPPAGPGGAPPPIPGGTPPSGATWRNMANAGPSYQAATGATRSEFDPVVAAQLEAMARAQRPPEEINAYLEGIKHRPIDPKIIQANETYLKTNPNYSGFASATKDIPTTAMERLSASPVAGYASGATNALTAGYMDEIGGGASALFGGDYAQTRDMLNANKHALADTHPIANFAGNVSGGLLGLKGAGGLASKVAPGAVALGANVLGRAAPAVGDAAYGALYGSGENNEDRASGALMGGATSVGGGMLGRGGAKYVGGVLSPVVAPAVQNLADHGIIMSAAQRAAANGSFLGRTRLGLENAMTHLPGLGDAIQAQRGRQIAQFGNGMINDAISPINATVQPGLSGNAAVDAAHNAVSDAYDKALPGITGHLDQPFHDTHAQILDRVNALPQDQRDLFNTIYSRKVAPFMPAEGQPMTGQALQDIKRGIDKPMMKLGRSGNPADEYLADELGNMRQNYFDWAERTAPAKAADFQNANRSFANMVRIDRAAGAAKRDGLFTPDQALTAIRTNSNPQQFASGNAPMQGYAQDAAQILPSTLPDSGTGKRTLVNGIAALVGGGASALNPAAMVPIGLGAAKSTRYLPGIDAGLQSLAIGERPQAMIDAGTWLRNQKKPVGMMGSLGTLSYFNH